MSITTELRTTAAELRSLLREGGHPEPVAQALAAAQLSLDHAALRLHISPEPHPAEHSLLLKMQHHGSGFTRLLAATWLAADPDNAAKLRAAFGHLLPRYEKAPEVPV